MRSKFIAILLAIILFVPTSDAKAIAIVDDMALIYCASALLVASGVYISAVDEDYNFSVQTLLDENPTFRDLATKCTLVKYGNQTVVDFGKTAIDNLSDFFSSVLSSISNAPSVDYEVELENGQYGSVGVYDTGLTFSTFFGVVETSRVISTYYDISIGDKYLNVHCSVFNKSSGNTTYNTVSRAKTFADYPIVVRFLPDSSFAYIGFFNGDTFFELTNFLTYNYFYISLGSFVASNADIVNNVINVPIDYDVNCDNLSDLWDRTYPAGKRPMVVVPTGGFSGLNADSLEKVLVDITGGGTVTGGGTDTDTSTGSDVTTGFLEGLVDGITDAFDKAIEGVTNGIKSLGSILTGIADAIKNLATTIADAVVGTGTLNFDGFKNLGLNAVFPFCIPFDLIESFKQFNVTAIEPIFSHTFTGALASAGTVEIDLTIFESVFKIIRFFSFSGFVVGLIMITRNIVKG